MQKSVPGASARAGHCQLDVDMVLVALNPRNSFAPRQVPWELGFGNLSSEDQWLL